MVIIVMLVIVIMIISYSYFHHKDDHNNVRLEPLVDFKRRAKSNDHNCDNINKNTQQK